MLDDDVLIYTDTLQCSVIDIGSGGDNDDFSRRIEVDRCYAFQKLFSFPLYRWYYDRNVRWLQCRAEQESSRLIQEAEGNDI